MMMRGPGVCVAVLTLAACATPRESLTAAEHEREASRHGDEARAAYAAYEPDATPALPCLLLGMHGGATCDGERENPTSGARQRAEDEIRLGTAHLDAAKALREHEERACRGVDVVFREEGPASGALPFTTQPLVDFGDPTVVHGVVIAFGPEARDADALQAAVACHRAHIESQGPGFQSHACALDDPAVATLVVVTPDAVLLQLRSDDEASARRAWERARDAARTGRAARERGVRGPR